MSLHIRSLPKSAFLATVGVLGTVGLVSLWVVARGAQAVYRQVRRAPEHLAIVLLLVAIMVAGCGLPPKLVEMAKTANVAIDIASPCLVRTYEREREDCYDLHDGTAEDRCLAGVSQRWEPVLQLFDELRAVRCEIEPAKCEAGR